MVEFDEFGPEKILEVHDSKTGMRGFTVVDNTARGVAKGGIRMRPDVTVEQVQKLARTMTWKCALADLSFGGGKSGIIADPREISREQKFDIVAAFARAIRPICPSLYVAAPDMNMAEDEMKVFADANGSFQSTTGKPATMCVRPGEECGIPHEYGSTGFGVFHAVLVAVDHLGLDKENTTVAIEGFGNVGEFAAKYLSEEGFCLVAVSDSRGCIYNKDGLDFETLVNTKKQEGKVTKYTDGEVLDGTKIFELPVDILIPAAVPDVIHEGNVDKVRAKIVVEAANIPMTPDIEEQLYKRGILVVPDFVANSGGVISSYSEYAGENPDEMFTLVESKIKKATRLVLDQAREDHIKPRDAAMQIAVERVRAAVEES